MNYPSGEDNRAVRIAIIIMALAVAAALLASCGEARSPAPGPTPVPDLFGGIGATLAWAGAIGAAAGLALSFIALFYPVLQPFAYLFRLAGIGGAGVSVTGAAYLWIANHYWWVLVIAALVGIGVGWYFWPRIHRLVDKRLKTS